MMAVFGALFALAILSLPVIILALIAWNLWRKAEQRHQATQRQAIENARMALELMRAQEER